MMGGYGGGDEVGEEDEGWVVVAVIGSDMILVGFGGRRCGGVAT